LNDKHRRQKNQQHHPRTDNIPDKKLSQISKDASVIVMSDYSTGTIEMKPAELQFPEMIDKKDSPSVTGFPTSEGKSPIRPVSGNDSCGFHQYCKEKNR
jgi:hypothetical protein